MLGPRILGSNKGLVIQDVLQINKFGEKWVCSSWEIPNIDKCCQDKCCLDKCHYDSWHLLKMVKRTYLKFGHKLISNKWYIPDMDKCRHDKCCLDNCHRDSFNTEIQWSAIIFKQIKTYTWLIFSNKCFNQSLNWYLTDLNDIFRG